MDVPDIVSAAEIRTLYERAAALLDADEPEDDGEDDFAARREAMNRRCWLAVETMRFCAIAAGALRDPSLGGVVIEIVERLQDFDKYAYDHRRVASDALTALLAAGLKVDAQVRELARHEESGVRVAVAAGLRPTGPAEQDLLRALMQDPAAAVRKAARRSLEAVAEVPWWTGKWKSDPAARLLPSEVEACGPALRRASELLDLAPYQLYGRGSNAIDELGGELAKLPDEIAIEAAEQLLRGAERYDLKALKSVLLPMVERPGGPDALDRLIGDWGLSDAGYLHQRELGEVLLESSLGTRRAICERCVARVLAAPRAERMELNRSPAWIAGSVAGAIWPPDTDVTPALDAVLSLHENEDPELLRHDHACGELAGALALPWVDPAPVLDRAIEARVAGYPAPWKRLGHKIDAVLSRAPRDVLRRTAERALQGEDDATVAWAEDALLGPAHDPALDGSLPERAATFVADPRLRRALFQSHRHLQRALPALRAELRRGGLSHRQAVETMEAIASLYGGLAQSGLRMSRTRTLEESAKERAEERVKALEAVAPFLGPPELSGPPTEEERAAVRRAREEDRDNDLEMRALLWMRCLSDGPWTEEERAVLDEYLALFRGGEVDALDYPLGMAIASKPDAALMPVLDEIMRGAGANTRYLLRDARAYARAVLGVEPTPAAAGSSPAGGDASGDGWDDDGDD